MPVVPDATAQPHVPFVRAIGVVLVPEVAVNVSDPLARVVVASLSLSVKTYPAALLVLTDTVSLAFERTPLPVGVNEIETVGPLEIEMTAFTVALIVVLEVWDAAEAIAGDSTVTTANAIAAMLPILFLCCVCFTIIFLA